MYSCVDLFSQDLEASDFYVEANNSFLETVDVTKSPFNAKGSDKKDDSAAVQKAIDFLSNKHGGGIVRIPEGDFYLSNLNLASNIHIQIDSKAILFPILIKDRALLFNLGNKKQALIKNVSIVGDGGRFTVDFRGIAKQPNSELGARVAICNNIKNFRIADFLVLENETKFPAINFGAVLDDRDNVVIPTNGLVENIEVKNAHYGYGVVQVQLAENILFRNLIGEGGVTLRLESGFRGFKNLGAHVRMDKIFGRNISCIKGQSALQLSPHTLNHGIVDVRGVTAVNCEYGVKIDKGFTTKKDIKNGYKAGTFDSKSIVKDVEAIYGETAQVRKIFLRFLPCELRDKIGGMSSGLKSITAPSLAAAHNFAAYKLLDNNMLVYTNTPEDFKNGDGHYKINFTDKEVVSRGFRKGMPKVLTMETDDYENCKEAGPYKIYIPKNVQGTLRSY